jgi:hypothetical protein
MQPLFPKWYKPDEMRKSLWAPRPFQLNICKNFKNRDWMMVSKKRVEFVKDDVIGHIVTRTSSEWQVIEIDSVKHRYRQSRWSKKGLNCQSFLLWDFSILHFVLGSHLTLQRNMSSLCLLVVLKSSDASFKGYFDTNIFDQTPTCDKG